MRTRLPLITVLGLAVTVAAVPGQPPEARPAGKGQYHRDGFSGRQPGWRQGGANVPVVVKDHRIVTDRYYNAPSCEYLKIDAQPKAGASADAEYVYFVYDTPKCPIVPGPGETASASVWVRGFRAGVQLRARVRLPRERDPENPEAEFAAYVVGDSYPDEAGRGWWRLTLGDPAKALAKVMPVLRLQHKRELDTAGAYIDQLILNVYTGPGATELWIDDLDLGPCPPEPKKPGRATLTSDRPDAAKSGDAAHPYAVEYAGGRILIDKKPFFMRAIRHTGVPMKDLRDANFNTVALPPDATAETIDEAIRQNFMLVAGVPLASATSTVSTAERDADRLAENFKRFRQGDGVLLWDLGGGRTAEQFRTVARTADTLREYDPRRPRTVNLWDGYSLYSDRLDVIGAHRFPLFTGLELANYRDWLRQRKALLSPGKMLWTWVQTHTPEWLARNAELEAPRTARGQAPDGEPAAAHAIGPTPEQIRLLTYLSLSAGCGGLGFWSDQALTNPALGRDRLLELFQLNCEMELLEPLLFTADDEATQWIKSETHPWVRAAIIRGRKGVLVLMTWTGPGSQFCPDQGARDLIKIVIPQVPEGADPWLLTPATYDNLRVAGGVRQVPGGTELTIRQFDLTAAVVFTNDHARDGLLARWQENIQQKYARPAARFAREQAREVFDKTRAVHQELLAVGAPEVPGANEYLEQAEKAIKRADRAADNAQHDVAYREARAALRPLRVLMREHWKVAVGGLTYPTASPFAVSYHTLPLHWKLAQRFQPPARFGANVLPHGGFELSEPAPAGGAKVSSLPGWDARESHLDAVIPTAAVMNVTETLRTLGTPPPKPLKAGDAILPAPPKPPLGRHLLMLRMDGKRPAGVDPKDYLPPQALERATVAADSPPVDLEPGSWARVSFWVNVPGTLAAPDGFLAFDSAGGEPLGVRLTETLGWKQHHLYRRVPADGKLRLTFALTGIGAAFVDDVRIEPLDDGAGVTERRK